MDREPGKDKADYRGGLQTEDKHKGTDFALRDLGVMARGVAVLAAAGGKVLRLRSNMPDVAVDDSNRKNVTGMECGNAVIIEHADGWQTQYCHLKQGSITVKVGDTVSAGAPIAEVGLSGLTEFPHLHFMVRQMLKQQPALDIDPFDGGVFETSQAERRPTTSLWETAPAYTSSIVMPPLITTAQPDRRAMWRAQETIDGNEAEALVVQARGFHTRAEDTWQFVLYEPGGRERFRRNIEQKNNRQLIQAFAGIKKPAAGFIPGVWSAEVTLIRGGEIIETRKQLVTVTN